LLFVVDAQLLPSLAEALSDAGCQAVHVADLGLLASTDQHIWNEAISRSAAVVTKERDFAPQSPEKCGTAQAQGRPEGTMGDDRERPLAYLFRISQRRRLRR